MTHTYKSLEIKINSITVGLASADIKLNKLLFTHKTLLVGGMLLGIGKFEIGDRVRFVKIL